MDKPYTCLVRLYRDSREDAFIIENLEEELKDRKRKGDKTRLIKDILFEYFSGEQNRQFIRRKTKRHIGNISQTSPTDKSNHPPSRENDIHEPVKRKESISPDDKDRIKRDLDNLFIGL